MSIAARLEQFDGKHVAVLACLSELIQPTPETIRELVAMADNQDAKMQTAATWLLKRFQDRGRTFDESEQLDLMVMLGRVTHWEARLHLLQMLSGWTVPNDRARPLVNILRELLTDDNKFVRAWAYNGLTEVAAQHPSYRGAVNELLSHAAEREAPAVKARIRNIRKRARWTTVPAMCAAATLVCALFTMSAGCAAVSSDLMHGHGVPAAGPSDAGRFVKIDEPEPMLDQPINQS